MSNGLSTAAMRPGATDMIGNDEEDLGFAEICAVLCERFGTRFELQITGNCVTLMAHLEGGIQVLITDCVGALSAIQWHFDGRASGFFIGVYRCELGIDGEHVDLPDRFAYACSDTAPPTAEAIGDLVREALEDARAQLCEEHRRNALRGSAESPPTRPTEA
jgi:hypothetical protein